MHKKASYEIADIMRSHRETLDVISRGDLNALNNILEKQEGSVPNFLVVLDFAYKKSQPDMVVALCRHRPAPKGVTEILDFVVPIKDKEFFDQVVENLPLSENNKATVFLSSAKQGNLFGVKNLAPLVDPRTNSSMALVHAVLAKNQEMVDFLYPLCDPVAALSYYSKEDVRMFDLRNRVNAEESKKNLVDCLKKSSPLITSPKLKM